MMCGYGQMGWGMMWMGLSSLVLLAAVTAGIVALVRYTSHTPAAKGSGDAEQILAERFARGEIDEQEFQQRIAVLRSF